MAKKKRLVNPNLAIRDTERKKSLDDLIVKMTNQAYIDGASHEEVGELQEQIKNGTYRHGDWERKVSCLVVLRHSFQVPLHSQVPPKRCLPTIQMSEHDYTD
jgi:hypothetical protein